MTTQTNLQKLTIRHLLRQSWHLVSGTKGAVFWLLFSALLLLVICQLIAAKLGFLGAAQGSTAAVSTKSSSALQYFSSMPLYLCLSFIMAPFFAGGFMIAIQRAQGQAVSSTSGLLYFYKWLPLGVAMILISLFSLIITAILILLPISILEVVHIHLSTPDYAYLAYGTIAWIALAIIITYVFQLLCIFALPLVIEKEFNPLRAVWVSIRASFKHLPLIILLLILSVILNTIGMVCFLVGMLWTMPMTFIMWGMVYRYIIDHQVS